MIATESDAKTPGSGPGAGRHLEPDRARAFLGLVRAGVGVTQAVDATLRREHGLGLHAFEVLLFLDAFSENGSMAMSELRRRTPLSQSRVSRLVAELERDGLVARTTDDRDTRALNVAITPAGIETFRAAQRDHLDDLERLLFSRLTSTEIRQLAGITEKILAGLNGGTSDGSAAG